MPLTLENQERARVPSTNYFVDFLIWLAMVDLKVAADPKSYDAAQAYLADDSRRPLLHSIAPHTGHTDSLFVYKAIEQLLPGQVDHLQFVSAKDTWSNPLKRAFAQMIIGDPYLFDRDNPDTQVIRRQIKEMQQLVNPNQETPTSLAIYPQGTRTPGAPIHDMPEMIASNQKIPLAIYRIEDAQDVFPKLDGMSQASFVIHRLIQRLRSRRGKNVTPVTVKLVDFIDPKSEEFPSRRELKARFYAAHSK